MKAFSRIANKGFQYLADKTASIEVETNIPAVIEKRLPQARAMVNNGNYLDGIQFLYAGEKFPGGWGLDRNYEIVNLHKIRQHSLELWRSNPIANAIFGRLETKVINDGLRIEALPEGRFVGFPDESEFLQDWTDRVEAFVHLYSIDPLLSDERERLNKYQLERQAYSTAKLSGDCLVIRRIDGMTMLPKTQLVDGKHIDTPLEFSMGINPKTGRDVINGVEIDSRGREVGYWVRTRAFNPNINNILNFGYVFISAFGETTGRRVANLIYGSRLRVDEYRGMPLLAHALQMLKQIDRTLDNAHLAMALDAQLVLSVVTDTNAPRDVDSIINGGPLKRASTMEKSVEVDQPNGGTKTVDFKAIGPGIIVDNLPAGRKIESHNTRHPNPNLDKAVLFGMNIAAASCEVPPEIMLLMFNNNFSASRQAVNEFEAVKRKEHSQFNPLFNDPLYKDILIALDITGRISTPGLMTAIINNDKITVNAWAQARWTSASELSVDMLKHVNTLEKAIANSFITRRDVALKFFGTRFEKVVARLKKENAEVAEANKPLAELEENP